MKNKDKEQKPIVVEPSASPKIVAEMNTDPKSTLDQNPYSEEEMKINNQKILSYFED